MVTVFRSRHRARDDGTPPSRPVAAAEPSGRGVRVACEPLFSFAGRPGGITVDSDSTVYPSDLDSAAIWRIGLGDGAAEPLIVPATGPDRLYSPAGIALAADGSLVVADATAHRVCSVGTDGSIRVLAGGASGSRDGTAGQASFRFPRAVAVGVDGTIFVADAGNDRIRQISPDGQVTTVAGSIYDYGDGTGRHARFRRPSGLAIDTEGIVYVADTGNNAVRRLAPDGQVTTLAGGPPGGDRDGTGRAIGLRWPAAVAVADDGWLWVPDYGNGKVRVVDPTGGAVTVLEISGLSWPAAVAALPGGRAVVAGSILDDQLERQGCLMIIDDGR